MPSSQQFIVLVKGRETGPYPLEQAAAMIASGKLPDDVLVRRSGEQDHQRVEEVPELVEHAGRLKRLSAERGASASVDSARHRTKPSSKADKAPRFRTTREMWIAAGCVASLLLLGGQVMWWWFNRPIQFPESPGVSIQFEIPNRLAQMRPPAPLRPTVEGLQHLVPTRVPGFERVEWLKSPTLTEDLLVVVYVTYGGEKTLDDLRIAERTAVDQPFGRIRPITTTMTNEREAHPTLSPDGLTLVYTILGDRNRLMIAERSSRDSDFSDPRPLTIENDEWPDSHHDSPQLIEDRVLRYAVSDTDFRQRLQLYAVRSGANSPFHYQGKLPFADPWPRYFVAKGGQQAYLPTKTGLAMTARPSKAEGFVTPDELVGEAVVGPHLTRFDDTIWVSPKEDLIFYCAPGKDAEHEGNHQLWMIRVN